MTYSGNDGLQSIDEPGYLPSAPRQRCGISARGPRRSLRVRVIRSLCAGVLISLVVSVGLGVASRSDVRKTAKEYVLERIDLRIIEVHESRDRTFVFDRIDRPPCQSTIVCDHEIVHTPTTSALCRYSTRRPDQTQELHVDCSVGWPLRSMRYVLRGDGPMWVERLDCEYGIPIPTNDSYSDWKALGPVVPLMPIPTGCLGNTLFYGLVWFIVCTFLKWSCAAWRSPAAGTIRR